MRGYAEEYTASHCQEILTLWGVISILSRNQTENYKEEK